jgi:aspartyl-tRNA(Asn)/glutamyl-tRNA(Gln) amidotransferase subunit C
MQVDIDLVRRLEGLARVSLTEAERVRCERDMRGIIGYFEQLAALDTAGVEPLPYAFPVPNVTRADETAPSLPQETILQNAPRQKDGCFLVQRTVE